MAWLRKYHERSVVLQGYPGMMLSICSMGFQFRGLCFSGFGVYGSSAQGFIGPIGFRV